MTDRASLSTRRPLARRFARGPAATCRGYTLVEMLTTLALVAILAGFTVPRLDWARWEADAGARQVRAALQGAQRLAVTQQSTVVVSVDTINTRLRILEDVNGDLAASTGERVTWRPLDGTVRFAKPVTALPGAEATSSLVNVGPKLVDGYPSLVFRRDGSASASATMYLRSIRRGETQYRALVVTQSTGRVDWWRAAGTAPLSWLRGNI